MSVLLPAPFGPAMPRISPGRASRSSPSSARVSPYHLRSPRIPRPRSPWPVAAVGVTAAARLVHLRRLWVNRSSTTAAIVTAPDTKLLRYEPAERSARPLAMMASSSAPLSVPMAVPRPPARLAPPMMTAAKTGNSQPDARRSAGPSR